MMCCDCLKNLPKNYDVRSLLKKDKKSFHHCNSCRRKYYFIGPKHCPNCYRSQNSLAICEDCKKWQEMGGIAKNIAFFKYNEAFSEWLERYKYQGGVHLRETFSDLLFEKLKKEKAIIVPIPMDEKKEAIRGFNQTEELLKSTSLSYRMLLGKIPGDHQAQSKKKKKERMALKQVFYIKEESETKEVILFDDVYTTGTTLKKAQECLESSNYEVKYTLTLAR